VGIAAARATARGEAGDKKAPSRLERECDGGAGSVGLGGEVVEKWRRSGEKWGGRGRKVAEKWRRSGGEVAEKWRRSGGEVEEKWWRCGGEVAEKWRRSGGGVAEKWRSRGVWPTAVVEPWHFGDSRPSVAAAVAWRGQKLLRLGAAISRRRMWSTECSDEGK